MSLCSIEELCSITDTDVADFLLKRAYGTTVVDENSIPSLRSLTLEYDKKALSFFFPSQKARWDEANKRGNPTKSDAVQKF